MIDVFLDKQCEETKIVKIVKEPTAKIFLWKIPNIKETWIIDS